MSRTFKALFELVVLDAPQHEDDGGDDGEDEGVGEVTVEGQLDHVSAQAQRARRLYQGGEDPPTDGAVERKGISGPSDVLTNRIY